MSIDMLVEVTEMLSVLPPNQVNSYVSSNSRNNSNIDMSEMSDMNNSCGMNSSCDMNDTGDINNTNNSGDICCPSSMSEQLTKQCNKASADHLSQLLITGKSSSADMTSVSNGCSRNVGSLHTAPPITTIPATPPSVFVFPEEFEEKKTAANMRTTGDSCGDKQLSATKTDLEQRHSSHMAADSGQNSEQLLAQPKHRLKVTRSFKDLGSSTDGLGGSSYLRPPNASSAYGRRRSFIHQTAVSQSGYCF